MFVNILSCVMTGFVARCESLIFFVCVDRSFIWTVLPEANFKLFFFCSNYFRELHHYYRVF